MTITALGNWYLRRTGAEMPPAVRLLFQASQSRIAPFVTSRLLVLQAPSADLLDGLLQHPDTCIHLGDRLGPTAVVIPYESVDAFRKALGGFGLTLADPAVETADPPIGSMVRRPRRP